MKEAILILEQILIIHLTWTVVDNDSFRIRAEIGVMLVSFNVTTSTIHRRSRFEAASGKQPVTSI